MFLRTEEKKRETLKGKEQAGLAPQILATSAAVEGPGADVALSSVGDKSVNAEVYVPDELLKAGHTDLCPPERIGDPASIEAQMDIPRPSVEVGFEKCNNSMKGRIG